MKQRLQGLEALGKKKKRARKKHPEEPTLHSTSTCANNLWCGGHFVLFYNP